MATETNENTEVEVTPQNDDKTQETPNLSKSEEKQVKIIERVIESKEIAPQDAFGKLTKPQVDLIKRTVARNATDDELRLFIQVCKGAQLNPFLRQVHFVKRWDSREGREVGAIQVGIDGFRSIAESSGAYAGNDDPIFNGERKITYGKDNKELMVPESATVTVRKIIQGVIADFTATARWDEYYPGEKMGFQWHIRPHLMLGKCAEALALRKAFPKLLSGMYAQEEMERTAQVDTESQKVQKGFEMLMNLINTSSLEDLEDYRQKMEASDKYTDAQKHQFGKAVDKRIDELKPKSKKLPPEQHP